ncbi:MAG: cytochrome C [Gammaproteobacteria bacterium]|nr:cytochrome C [Gammaproteobacteria bacterium]
MIESQFTELFRHNLSLSINSHTYQPAKKIISYIINLLVLSLLIVLIPSTVDAAVTLDSAKWNDEKRKLTVKGMSDQNFEILVVNAFDTALVIGDDSPNKRDRWKVKQRRPSVVACRVAIFEAGTSNNLGERDVANAPADCAPKASTEPPTEPPTEVSINSTSQNGTPVVPVPEQPFVNMQDYKVFAINDLGMHCGDFDTRISSILPPFNVLHATVIQRGVEPNVLTPEDGIRVVYSAASNVSDPILTGINSAGSGPVYSSMLADGSVFKTNFWDVAREAYDPFYPPMILPAFYPPGANILDLGLPMPNVERFYLGDGELHADQQSMPGRFGPYLDNAVEPFEAYVMDQPFFINTAFKFGYVSESVNYYEAAGIPITAFDDFGRENPWPLYRVQAHDASGNILASNDTVVPISGEANCGACHGDPMEDMGNGSATYRLEDAGIAIVGSSDDPQFDSVPLEVSREYAADLNLLRLHDLKHGSGNPDGPKYETDLEDQTPVVCQSCHYTPALDLAQLGPLSGDGLANGRMQTNVRSMSNVMHSHHGDVTDQAGERLFPEMPAIIKNDDGIVTNSAERRDVLNETCYQCHPGRRTDCLRGAMANGGMLCQDCHGNMEQVGNDFTRNVSIDNPGAFELGGDFYTNPDQPRVPWANEPGCGSCHTGDAVDNMAGHDDVVINPANSNGELDNIRLLQAYLSSDPKATPIVPTNKRFAENVVTEENPAVVAAALETGTDPADDDRVGNPMLYRVSTGHEGIFCEACHGATHGIWPNKNPNANDNVAAVQLQGHRGTITECSTCHDPSAFEDSGEFQLTMDGPHGMHAVGSHYWNKNHKEGRKEAGGDNTCQACHGTDGKGTVLSSMAKDRVLECKDNKGIFCADEGPKEFPKGHQVGCADCHENEI